MTGTTLEHHRVGGFAAVTLRSAFAGLTTIPALGARIVSLRSPLSGREWLWRPEDGRGLFACAPGTSFEQSPLAGIDECLPTVAPCETGGVQFPDHGETWSAAWELDHAACAMGAVRTRVALRTLPLGFTRTLTLDRDTVHFNYLLENSSAQTVRYLWALHPLFALQPGDRVEYAGQSLVQVTATKTPGPDFCGACRWPNPVPHVRLDRWELGADNDGYCKAFLPTAPDGRIALVNARTGDRLELSVDPLQVPVWGYWITRGGWHGHSHAALEPTNAAADWLTECGGDDAAYVLAPGEKRTWGLKLRLAVAKAS